MCSISHLTRENDVRTLVQSIYGLGILQTDQVMKQRLKRYIEAPTTELKSIMDRILEREVP
jgi:hypothetical protein